MSSLQIFQNIGVIFKIQNSKGESFHHSTMPGILEQRLHSEFQVWIPSHRENLEKVFLILYLMSVQQLGLAISITRN